MRVRRGGCAVLLAGIAMLTSACGVLPSPVGPPSSIPFASVGATASAVPTASAGPDVLLEIVQLRGDVASGHIELRVTNESDAPLTVTRATYVSSRWTEPMTREDDAEIPPGQRRNLRLALPEPTCDRGPIEHLATLELADGTRVEQAPTDPLEQLPWLGVEVCDLRDFEEQVAALTWLQPEIPADGSGPATLRLEVAPVQAPGAQTGSLEALTATTLLTPVDAAGSRIEALPLGLPIERGDPRTVLALPLEPGRCDLHAIAEDKQGTILRLLGMMGGEPIELVLVSPKPQREALLDWAVARCAALP